MCFSVQVDIDLKRLAHRFDAQINEKSFDHFKQMEQQDSHQYKYVYPEDKRIFSKIWTPIICDVRGQREIRPMRYQMLPHFCETDKYMRLDENTGKQVEVKNTFNAKGTLEPIIAKIPKAKAISVAVGIAQPFSA